MVLVLVVGACGDDDGGGDTATSVETTTTSVVREPTTVPPSTTTPDVGDLPGEPIDLYPHEGASLAVAGVDRDDTLAVRSGPGTEFEVVAELEPLAVDVVATGHNRRVDDAIWSEVDAAGQRGWAHSAYLLHLGASDDVTDELADPSGDLPRAATVDDLAVLVAELRSSAEPPSRHALIEDAEVGELGSITVDVIGFGDDALGGERLHILAEPVDGGFVVQTVQRLLLCSRGVTEDGLCV